MRNNMKEKSLFYFFLCFFLSFSFFACSTGQEEDKLQEEVVSQEYLVEEEQEVEEVEEVEEEAQEEQSSDIKTLEQEANQALEAMLPSSINYDEVEVNLGTAGEPAAVALPELGSKLSYIVRAGDSLSKIAKQIFGAVDRWKDLAEISSLQNPNVIHPGQVIYYQLTEESLGFAKSYLNMPKKEHVVKKGDTLSKLAFKIYGNVEDWRTLWRYNSYIGDPDKIEVGMKIVYPVEEKIVKLDPTIKKQKIEQAILDHESPAYDLVVVGSDE